MNLKLLLILIYVPTFTLSQNQSEKELDERTPFDKVLYIDEAPHIEVDGNWVELLSIENIAIDTFTQIAQEEELKDWKEGFHSYFNYLLYDLDIHKEQDISATYSQNNIEKSILLPLKVENSELAKAFHDSIVKSNRIDRIHHSIIPDDYEYLFTRVDGHEQTDESWLKGEEAIHDLEYLEWEIENNYSYKDLTGFDYRIGLDAIRSDLNNGITKRDFALQLKMLMANFGDGHSRVPFSNLLKGRSVKWLPFKIVKHGDEFYAVDTHTKSDYISGYPQITKVNDVSIEELYALSTQLVPKSTQKFVARSATQYLFYIQLLLQMKGLPVSENVAVEFSNGSGQKSVSIKLDRYRYPKLVTDHVLKDSIIDGNIGFIAINNGMESRDSFIDSIHLAMRKMKSTDGLIIDIRRNGGGRREPLEELLPYFIKTTKIVNAAHYRIDERLNHHPTMGFLKRRMCYPSNIPESTYHEVEEDASYFDFKQAVDEFSKTFIPSYKVSEGKYSNLHYMAVEPDHSGDKYYYDKSVIVLIDEGCFSASDIFAAGIRKGDNVRLFGNITGGGSGYSKRIYLPNSNVSIKLSRMVSFQPDGNLYDGYGVHPDVEVDYTLSDRMGLTDTMLDKAIELIHKKK